MSSGSHSHNSPKHRVTHGPAPSTNAAVAVPGRFRARLRPRTQAVAFPGQRGSGSVRERRRLRPWAARTPAPCTNAGGCNPGAGRIRFCPRMRAIAFPGQSDPRFCPRTRVIAFSGRLESVQWRVRKQERKARREGSARFSLTAGFLPRSSSCAATEGDLRFWEAYLRLPFHSAAFSQAPRFLDIEGACDALPPQSPRFLDNGGACGSLPRSREDQGPAKVILAGAPTTPLLRNRPDSWTTGASAAPLRNLGDSLPEPHSASPPHAARRMDLASPYRSPNGPRLPIPLTEHDAKRFAGESTLNNCFVTSDESAMSRIAQGLRSAATGDLRRPRPRGLHGAGIGILRCPAPRGLHGDGIGIPRRLKLRALRGIEPGALRRREPSRFERRRARALGACAPAFRHHAGERSQHVQNLQQSQQVRPGSR